MLLQISIGEINPVIPTTVLGLIGVLFFYLYSSYISKKNKELKEIQSIQSDTHKVEVIEMRLNEFGTRVPVEGVNPLDAKDKYDLLKRLIRAKSIRYLISAIVAILLAVVIGIFLTVNNQTSNGHSLKLRDLNLEAYFVKNDGSLTKPLTYDELKDISSLDTYPDDDEYNLRMQFKFTEDQVKSFKNFQFNFGKPFSDKLGSNRGNPIGWSPELKNGVWIYKATSFKEIINFEVAYVN